MQSRKESLATTLQSALERHRLTTKMPGLRSPAHVDALVRQLVDSVRRVEFVRNLHPDTISERRADPVDDIFDPIRGAFILSQRGQIDEASWLIFLATHFGKHRKLGWKFVKDIYGRLGQGPPWSWDAVSRSPSSFRKWLRGHQSAFKSHRFGNHRKYQSIDADNRVGTGAAIESYVKWVGPGRSHKGLFDRALATAGGDGRQAFDLLYGSMKAVTSFGRMGRFDYLTMIGKVGIADIEPGSAYLSGATGPVRGGRLLFAGSTTAKTPDVKGLDKLVISLGDALGVGMQVIEDALCNWQKSPDRYVGFRG